ncbi:aminopeptidase P family protein [Flavonifractor plautii]|nr:aminopeptidase P family protein [Flavonifractor plautii]
MPRGYILQAGDIIKFDVGYQYLGYWSDIARTFAVGGTAPDEALELYDTLYRANRLGVSMLKPGVAMRDIYSAIREEVEKSRLVPKYPRGHMGHSIGCGVGPEEYPTIAPEPTTCWSPTWSSAWRPLLRHGRRTRTRRLQSGGHPSDHGQWARFLYDNARQYLLEVSQPGAVCVYRRQYTG